MNALFFLCKNHPLGHYYFIAQWRKMPLSYRFDEMLDMLLLMMMMMCYTKAEIKRRAGLSTTTCCTLYVKLWLNVCSSIFRDIDDMMTIVQESQKVFDVNPWDFEPDFYPAVGQLRATVCFITFN